MEDSVLPALRVPVGNEGIEQALQSALGVSGGGKKLAFSPRLRKGSGGFEEEWVVGKVGALLATI